MDFPRPDLFSSSFRKISKRDKYFPLRDIKLHQWRVEQHTTPTVKISRKKGETKIRTRYRQAENEDITELLVGEKKKGIIALRRTWCNNRSAEIFVSSFLLLPCVVWLPFCACAFWRLYRFLYFHFIFGPGGYRVVSIVGGTNYTFFGPIFTMTTVMLLPPMPLSSSSLLFSSIRFTLEEEEEKKKKEIKRRSERVKAQNLLRPLVDVSPQCAADELSWLSNAKCP